MNMKPGMLIVQHKVKIDPNQRHDGYIDMSFATSELKTFMRVYSQFFDTNLNPIQAQDKSQSRTKMTTTISMYLVEFEGRDVLGFLESLRSVFNVV